LKVLSGLMDPFCHHFKLFGIIMALLYFLGYQLFQSPYILRPIREPSQLLKTRSFEGLWELCQFYQNIFNFNVIFIKAFKYFETLPFFTFHKKIFLLKFQNDTSFNPCRVFATLEKIMIFFGEESISQGHSKPLRNSLKRVSLKKNVNAFQSYKAKVKLFKLV